MQDYIELTDAIKKSKEKLNGLSIELIRADKGLDDLLARVEAYRRKAEEEKRASQQDYDRLAGRILEVIDDLESGELKAAEPEARLQFIRTRLTDAINREGIVQMAVDGSVFDAQKQEVLEVVVDHSRQEGTVVDVLKPGYARGQRTLRKAGVVITRKEAA